jgi:DNA damage-binding protein 1
LDLNNFEIKYKEKLKEESLPRSVLFNSFDDVDYLFCGMGDGNLYYFKIDIDKINSNIKLSDSKKVSLGTKPILLTKFKLKGVTDIFASSDRPTVIFGNGNKKILFSNVNLKEINGICKFNTKDFSECFAFSGDSALMIGSIDDIQKLHINKIKLNEQPRKIVYHKSSNCFVVGCLRKSDDDINVLRLINGQTFDFLNEVKLDKAEFIASLTTTSFNDDNIEYVICGTSYILPEEYEPRKGKRNLIFRKNSCI